jgi:hypothetical protein
MQFNCPGCGQPLVEVGQYQLGCPHCGRTLPKPGVPSPVAGVYVIADLLSVLGYLALPLNFVSTVVGVGLNASMRKTLPSAGQIDSYGAQLGDDSAVFFQFLLVSFAVGVFTIPVYVFLIRGAWLMKQQRNFGMSKAACILAMLPCSPAFIFGLPIGIWGLMKLNRPGVREAFRP